ncbi:DUF1028 domain-containing protein [[Clostridium] symbiosum]|uniref:DUF1028 domain-containing protein n=1 Tax=Clostridium symbiosum TaxID=1512 RepID=UPI001D069BA0|nr:DUF1028 domain-containing protein [[Clostridium] symbiosum]MCB6610786.1 DUF1028 domain-containing protein [[Clostridium] symbiosum]MCB6930953.1 DUF1028 domain-containing protein [[Clostridium] symbiosum]
MNFNTYSIIARCETSGCIGGAAASYYPGLGAFSPYIRQNYGVIASQGWVNPFLNESVMRSIMKGADAEEALHKALLEDPGKDLRQISVVDCRGNSAAFTGEGNDPIRMHLRGKGYVIAGNLLTSKDVLYAAEEAFLKSEKEPLPDRIMKAMLAADAVGGDKRGKMAAVIRVEKIVGFPYIDFRIDDHPQAVHELNLLYEKHKQHIFDTYDEWVERVKKGIKD